MVNGNTIRARLLEGYYWMLNEPCCGKRCCCNSVKYIYISNKILVIELDYLLENQEENIPDGEYD